MQNDLFKIVKPIDKPQHISLLIPTRGRPEYLDKVFDSIGRTIGNADDIDAWIYVDNDDDITKEYIHSNSYLRYPFKINWVVRERTISQGQMVNILRQRCTTNPGIYMPFGDDYILTTGNWDGAIRDTFNRYPDGIVLGHIPDPELSCSDQLTMPVLSAQWANVTGKLWTNFFPFWFDDTWLDQVAQMVRRKVKIDITVEPIGGKGKTPRLKNLPFWSRFFNNLMDERIKEANLLRKAIYPEDSPEFHRSVEEAERLAAKLMEKREKTTIDSLLAMERAHSSFPEKPEPHLIALFLILEAKAVSHLCGKADSLMQAGNFEKALKMLDNIALAEQEYKNINYLRVVCLKRLGRTREASGAAMEELILQPEHKASQEIYGESEIHQLFSSGISCLSEGKPSEALTYFEQVKHFYSKIPNLEFARATALVQLGKLYTAKKACEMELAIQPKHEGVKRLLEQTEKAINEYEENNNKATNIQVKPIDHISASDSIQIDDTKRKRTGIIVFGHSRPLLLQNLLRALHQQGTTNDIHVWLDGHHGRSSLIKPVTKCRELVQKEFPEVHLTAMNSNIGIEKLTIDGLNFMSSRYDRIIVLEDDCFPTSCAIDEFEKGLNEIERRPEVYSVYGHHFLTESEGETITRFQGWGWATTRDKLLPVLAEMKRCFTMAEPDYLRWVHQNLTPEVIRRLDVTPGRNCVPVIASLFCWDGCTCLVTAMRGNVHKKTRKRVIYNCGMGDGSTHFPENDKFRLPPLNMITPQEVWSYYDSPSEISRKTASPQTTSPQDIAQTNPSAATFPGHKSQTRQAEERAHKEGLGTQIVVDGLIFTNVKRTKHLNNSVGFNDKYIIKIEHEKHPLKLRSLSDEIDIIKHLNSRECVSCPRLVSEGRLKSGERYFIQERIERQQGFNTADMVFSILEQKNFGVCEGDLKKENLIFDSDSVCYIIDYDQAIYDERFVRMGNIEYLDWFAHFFADRWRRFGHTDFYKWGEYDKNEIFGLFKNDSFNLAATTLFKEQITTNTKSGIYHSLRTDKVYIDGARDLNPRLSALNTIEFKKGESVLDVGCNMGLLGHYLHDRGCRVTGIDMDRKIIIGAKMVANILNKDIQFKHLDLDTEKIEVNYDTICLFSVIHHVKKFKQITENIAQRCNRIILECGLKEHGSKPIGDKWTNTSGWEFNSFQELVRYLEAVFRGFKFRDYHSKVDRDRQVISFTKEYAATAIQLQSKPPTDIQENKFVVQQSDNESEYLVSTVVSTYNSERFIRGCLDDLENQTIADRLEIIVVNSGSQQNEEAIVKEFQQKYDNIKYIRTEERETIYKAWNRAIKAASGKYITNANTDDRHRKDALEIMVSTLQANPDVALVYSDQIRTETPNDTFENHHGTQMDRRPEYSRARLLFGCCVGSQPMWRKSLHNELGYFDESLACSGDWDFWLRISSRYKFKHITEFLGLYYYNREGIEHGRRIHSWYERYMVGRRYGTEYIRIFHIYEHKNNPLVSIVIPVYNMADYVAEAIESVLIQNYMNFELIVVDDGSTDRTREAVLKFKDPRVKYFYKENGGPYSARNLGAKKARGDFIVPLDADDMITPDYIARHLQEFERCPDADLIYCDDCLIDEDCKPIRVIERPEYTDRKLLIGDLFRCGFPIVPFRTCIRKSVFDRIGLFDDGFRNAMDYDMIRRFVKHGLKAHHLKAPLYLRRMIPDSVSRKVTDEKVRAHFEVLRRFTESFSYDELFPDVAWDKIAPERRQLHAKCLAAVTYLAIGQAYVKTTSPIYGKIAFGQACSELRDSLKMDPGNTQIRQLLQKCELGRQKYDEQLQQYQNITADTLSRSVDLNQTVQMCPTATSVSCGTKEDKEYLVTAIVSTYNSEKFLRGCLDDLEHQTIADKLEIIVVNSGSKQNEDAIVRQYQRKHNNIVYIKTEHREGIYAAWNRAVKAARGRFITNANTDDRHRKDALEIMVSTLQANPDIALVYGDQIQTETPNDTFENHHGTQMNRRPEYSRAGLLFICCVGSQPMWRKSLHNELGYFDDTLTCAADWDFWLRVSSKYKFKHIPEFLGLYYYNEDGIEHGKKIHGLYERYIVGKRYGNPYISVIPLYQSKDNPLVSVIMPAYNAAEYIAEAIESVLIQNYRNFELIVVDDGSTDNTKDIVAGFKDDKIKYFYKENAGPASARNLGIKKAASDFIVPLDADDMITPDCIARHLQEFERCPDADFIYCDDYWIDVDCKPVQVFERREYTDRKSLIRDLFRGGFPVVPFRTCIRRSVFDKIGLFDEGLLVGEDYDMMRRFVKHGLKAHHLKAPLYLRRMAPDSISRKVSDEKVRAHFEVLRRFTESFSYDELFPDVAWDKIAPESRQLHAKRLAAITYLAIGQTFIRTHSPIYGKMAFGHACSELRDSLKMDPGNQRIRQLLQKCELGRQKYDEQILQAVR